MDKQKSSWGVSNFIAVIILAAIVIVGGSLLGRHVSNKQAQQSVAGTQTQFTPVVKQTISYDGQNGKNALDLLKTTHQITTQDSSIGIFVTSIDGVTNDDTTYWMFYVNGTLAPMGADQYQTKDTDKIEWRYETLQ